LSDAQLVCFRHFINVGLWLIYLDEVLKDAQDTTSHLPVDLLDLLLGEIVESVHQRLRYFAGEEGDLLSFDELR